MIWINMNIGVGKNVIKIGSLKYLKISIIFTTNLGDGMIDFF